jgi:hypothetical protein
MSKIYSLCIAILNDIASKKRGWFMFNLLLLVLITCLPVYLLDICRTVVVKAALRSSFSLSDLLNFGN